MTGRGAAREVAVDREVGVDLPVEGTFSLAAMGVPVDVDVCGDRAGEVLEQLPELWEHCPVTAAEPRAVRQRLTVVHDRDEEAVARAEERGAIVRARTDDLLQLLTQRITVTAIDALAGGPLHLFHAACVASPADGSAVGFVAAGGTGKTTLVRALGPGRWYVTDEALAVDDDGHVTAYPKPLSIRRAPDSPYKDETAPSRLGLAPPVGPVRLRALHLLHRDDAHEGAPVVERLDPLDALVALTPTLSHLAKAARPLQRVAALCESLGGAHRVTYRDARDLARLLEPTGWAP